MGMLLRVSKIDAIDGSRSEYAIDPTARCDAWARGRVTGWTSDCRFIDCVSCSAVESQMDLNAHLG